MLFMFCTRLLPTASALLGRSRQFGSPYRALQFSFPTNARHFASGHSVGPQRRRRHSSNGADGLQRDAACMRMAEADANNNNNNNNSNDNNDDMEGIDIDMQLDPVDVKKLALPLHTMAIIPPDVVANVKAKDKTIVFSPQRKQLDVNRRISRMKYRYSIQPLGRVLHFRFFALNENAQSGGTVRDVTLEKFHQIKEVLRTYTRFLVTDELWPLEVSADFKSFLEENRRHEEGQEQKGQIPLVMSEVDVAVMVSRILAKELRVGAWCGISCTPILAKMACDAGRREHQLRDENILSGGIISIKHYDIQSHEALREFVADMSLSDIPIMGTAQVQLLKDIYGITKCGEIIQKEQRLGFSLSPSTMDFFLSIAHGTMRLRGEVGTTLLRKASRCKTTHLRRESQFGRVVSDDQFIATVMAVFDNVYSDLIAYDLITGRVSLQTRRTFPRVSWVTEECEDLHQRTSNRDIIREAVMRIARRFAPRRTREKLDVYIISVFLSDIRTWAEENGESSCETSDNIGNVGGMYATRDRAARGSSRKVASRLTPAEKTKRVRTRISPAQKNNKKRIDPSAPRGIVVVM